MGKKSSSTSKPIFPHQVYSEKSGKRQSVKKNDQNTVEGPDSIVQKPFIDVVLAQSSRHLFGPTVTPQNPPQPNKVVSIAHLLSMLGEYINDEELKIVKLAFQFSDEAHLGQYRQSGEPYITHPVFVAEICASWKLDVHAIMAALLHDVMEDQGVLKSELADRFGPKVADLVDGLSKLDKMEFRSLEEAQAENFRKMLLAMSRDVRVILIKLADRLHNIRTLDAVPFEKRRRVARETLDVYAPIAHRLGLNNTYRELQDSSFKNYNPSRYRTLEKAVRVARGNRREVIEKILENLKIAIGEVKIQSQIQGREKTIYSIYRKMRKKHLSFSQVLDVYGFRIVVEEVLDCYKCLGALHSLYKPVPGKFKDYIAIPKANGYQSLHTTLIGPFGVPIEFQIRTRNMHEIAEAGVAAHWLYKNGSHDLNDVQTYTHQWLKSLLDVQAEATDSREFLEQMKIDLFPEEVYVFTPKSKIITLPRGATALDFAYFIHSDIGNQCIAIKVNNELLPLGSVLKNGDIVEVITSPYSKPKAAWLGFVKTSKARSAIRYYLKTMRFDESVKLGESLVKQNLQGYGIEFELVSEEIWGKVEQWIGNKPKLDVFADIGLGRRSAAVIAKKIVLLMDDSWGEEEQDRVPQIAPAVEINGSEGMAIQLASCCHPIPGDAIMGYVGSGSGMVVHTTDCRVAQKIYKRDANLWVTVEWAPRLVDMFDVSIKVVANYAKGVVARIAADLAACDANIVHVAMDELKVDQSIVMRFTIQVWGRVHLAKIMRTIKANSNVTRIMRERAMGGDIELKEN